MPQNCLESIKRRQRILGRVEPEVMPKVGSEGLYTNLLHWFKVNVLEKLARKKYAADFLKPLDNPNFYKITKNPLDIGIIRRRIDNRYYSTLAEALRDFRIMLDNYCEYFAPHDESGTRMGRSLLKLMIHRQLGPEVPLTRHPRRASPKAVHGRTLKSQCEAKLRKFRLLAKNLQHSFARTLLGKCDYMKKKLSECNFRTREQFMEEFRSILHDFRTSAVQYLHSKGYPNIPKKPSLEEPMDGSGSDSDSAISCDCESCSDSSCDCSCSCSCQDSSLSSDSDNETPAKKIKF
ncbi:uncharacterized protein LOC117583269 [Drosophila guanche]|uniref:Bromo domain-containing protein n=1 Tax=Drosophila guanche TaxID=7266 RepID=A0A3B0K554_DROGU|nr:uncharacterized protein LOC117583269 [Drosophila guanche]SPP81129.1 Hypothetical predicted protein [Drosophila guanche]